MPIPMNSLFERPPQIPWPWIRRILPSSNIFFMHKEKLLSVSEPNDINESRFDENIRTIEHFVILEIPHVDTDNHSKVPGSTKIARSRPMHAIFSQGNHVIRLVGVGHVDRVRSHNNFGLPNARRVGGVGLCYGEDEIENLAARNKSSKFCEHRQFGFLRSLFCAKTCSPRTLTGCPNLNA